MDELEGVREENARLREDIGWLFAERRGQPPLSTGELRHDWTWDDYSNRFITDYGTEEATYLKLRRVKCATCGQFWTHP